MARIILEPSGRAVECAAGDTVLGALEKAGYALPNNCRAGACGECKVCVTSGQFDQGMVLGMALSAAERAQGFGLMCMAKPTSEELRIEWGTADAKPKLFPPREHQLFVVVDRIMRTPRIAELRLRPVGQPMRYWPGQYVMLGATRAGVPMRGYSIANAPVLCLASGSGLAPILALTEAALRRNYRPKVTLVFSARTQADLYDEGLMSWWESRHRNFRYQATLTRENLQGRLHGRIPAILGGMFKDLSAFSVFIAGSPEFVADSAAAARALGALPERVHTEGFTPRGAAVTPPREQLAFA